MLLRDGTELCYRVREHHRARGVGIRVSHHAGMVVTIPYGFDRDRLAAVLEQKRDWIERALSRYPMKPEPYHPPERITLEAIGEEWAVEYEAGEPRRVKLARRGDRLLHVSGALNRPELVHWVLRRWLLIQGRRHLIPWLHRVADELGYKFHSVTVRVQRGLWGSCTQRNTISLNARLLLIPADLVRYVFVHELAHTRHQNHSPAFWQEVEASVPDYRTKLRELKRRWHTLGI